MQYYNVHSHTFTMTNAPRRFLHLYLPDFVADAVDKITNTQPGTVSVEFLLSKLGGNGGKRYASFLKIGKSKNQAEVFDALMNSYTDDQAMKFVALTMNMEYCGAGPSTSGFEGQLEEVLNIKRRYPNRLLVFLGLDPRWAAGQRSIKEKVEQYFSTPLKINDTTSVNPFCGIKIYPSMGYYPFDQRLMETFEWAAVHNVPVLSHCYYLGGIYNNDEKYLRENLSAADPYSSTTFNGDYVKERGFWRWLLGTKNSNNNLDSCSYFMEPNSFVSMMDHFKAKGTPLKLCLAHFGGGNQMKDRNSNDAPFGAARRNWFLQVKDMLLKYDTLYTDISYALHDQDIFPTIFDELNHPSYGDRIMFGTDFFLTEREQEENKTYSNFKTAAKARTLPNFDHINAWDQAASKSVAKFLKSDFYDPAS
ncbi:MAG TPA: amidohydrolase family protein [Parafilimonas sp.]|nr:amidohydrolase family protein [Parafilimonas sp.]